MTEQRSSQTPPAPSAAPDPGPRVVESRAEQSEQIVLPTEEQLSTVGSAELWGRKLRVVEQIGRGGMSYIVRGTDTTLHRELALKVSPVARERMSGAQLARFIEEAQITAQLEHPNVVPVHELGLDPEGRAYFSMKLVRGKSLQEILDLRRAGDMKVLSEFGLRRLLDVFLQVCQAMEYAHACGVVHRDLKPANIMVGDFGEVLVMDWGVAKLIGRADQPAVVATEVSGALAVAESRSSWRPRSGSIPPSSHIPDVTSFRSGKQALATQAGMLVGTPGYMSPEQAKGLSVDERSDLYSLGVILYEILCDVLPFDDEDPIQILNRMLSEKPRRPSQINRSAPLALETLAMRLLEKDPARRSITLSQVRAHVQDHIEGIGRDYQRVGVWTNVTWMLGGLSLFAFLVWYLTGQSISALFVLAPATVFNALGWFLLVLALGCPLWSAYAALRLRPDRDRFSPPNDDEQFVSGYLARRTFATTVAPVFQLIFIVEMASRAITRWRHGDVGSADFVQRMTAELRAEWAQSLIVILIFLFAYLFFLSSEVRFARQIDDYDALVSRPRWEAVWPFFLIILLLFTLGTTHVLDWALSGGGDIRAFIYQQVLTQPLNLVEIAKTLVFQGTFLSVVVLAMVLLAFPPPEVLAALRLPYQSADEASVQQRTRYLVRSIAVFRVARVHWLYGGAMIGGLTAMTILLRPVAEPLVNQVLYILGPSLIGFLGYSLTRRYVRRVVWNAPALQHLLKRQGQTFRGELKRIIDDRLEHSAWSYRIMELVVPFACILLYLLWNGSGLHERAIQQLIMPMSTQQWLLILPYVLLIPVLLVRDVVPPSVRRRARGR